MGKAVDGKVGVGIVGVGGMGGRHARNLAREIAAARVVAVVDPDGGQRAAVAAETGALELDDAQALVEHHAVDAVLVAAPDRFHAALARACVEAGKPVLCEKPLATTAEEAWQVIEAESAAGRRPVQVGFMREYDPAHVDVKRVLDSGELGRPLVFRGVHVNPTKGALRAIGEVMSNSVVHDIHSARWMVGEEIVEVTASAVAGAPDRPDTARFALVHLRFAGGALGTIECNCESGYGYEVEVRVTAERGSVETASLRTPWVSLDARRGQPVEADWLERFDAAYVAEARAWVDSVLAGTPTGPSAWDGYVAMVVADACTEAARSGGVVRVELPERPAPYR